MRIAWPGRKVTPWSICLLLPFLSLDLFRPSLASADWSPDRVLFSQVPVDQPDPFAPPAQQSRLDGQASVRFPRLLSLLSIKPWKFFAMRRMRSSGALKSPTSLQRTTTCPVTWIPTQSIRIRMPAPSRTKQPRSRRRVRTLTPRVLTEAVRLSCRQDPRSHLDLRS